MKPSAMLRLRRHFNKPVPTTITAEESRCLMMAGRIVLPPGEAAHVRAVLQALHLREPPRTRPLLPSPLVAER